jgi:hypothetical protein
VGGIEREKEKKIGGRENVVGCRRIGGEMKEECSCGGV